MEHTMDFTRGPIVGPLLRFSMPILLALFLQALYGAVDLMVVGKFALAQDVSGVAVGSQIMHTVTGLISSLAMGTTILHRAGNPVFHGVPDPAVFCILQQSSEAQITLFAGNSGCLM